MNPDSGFSNLHALNILIIEDDKSWQKILGRDLAEVNDKLTITKTVEEAKEKWRNIKFDMIVTDLELSPTSSDILDDLEMMVESLKKTYLFKQPLPIIVVTAHEVSRERLIRVLNYGGWIKGWFEKSSYSRIHLMRSIQTVYQSNVPGAGITNLTYSSNPNNKITVNKEYLIKLFQLLTQRFNSSEIKKLCWHLDVDYESFEGNKEDKVQELLDFLNRRQQINDLLEMGIDLRPDIGWPQLSSE